MRNDAVRQMVDLRDRTLQKARIAFGNRVDAINREQDSADEATQQLLTRWYARFLELEEEADKDIAQLVKHMPIVKKVTRVKGIGPMLAAKLVSMIDIERADTVSSLWRYAGWACINGQRERPVAGEKLHYNSRLKTTCYLIGTSFLKSNSPYRKVYDDARAYYSANRPDWTEGHRHNAAMRKMIKMFLSHYWLIARQMEAMPITYPYAHERLGHQHYYSPEDFGW